MNKAIYVVEEPVKLCMWFLNLRVLIIPACFSTKIWSVGLIPKFFNSNSVGGEKSSECCDVMLTVATIINRLVEIKNAVPIAFISL